MALPVTSIARAAFCTACFVIAASPSALAAYGSSSQSSPAPQSSVSPSPLPNATTNPFPSPSPTATPGPFGNGFGTVGFSIGNASGGVIPSPVATGNPPFPSSNATGFFIDLTGRLSAVYTAALHFSDSVLHGADHPVVTQSFGHLYYTPRGGTFGAGIGYESLQRSSNTVSANGFGVGAVLLPDLRRNASPYAGVSYFPSARTQGISAGITTFEAGVAFKLRRSGVLLKVGYSGLSYPNANTSPTRLGNLLLGAGASF